ncbi:uncharacterized protein G2W53_038115 [Senna tora]|uniref:Uncharacterized protein n=1 Tax=Senna tora TaxID=362788 RepID=A0A834W6G9_9FABA|nr:uncharacterized protein G2W53_038115 [Senna tora]
MEKAVLSSPPSLHSEAKTATMSMCNLFLP